MNEKQVRRYWNGNADVWTKLARAGYDTYRDHLNTPAFFRILPDVTGLSGLDIGCGEGYNTRLLAQRGARMTAMDLSDGFVRHAKRENDLLGQRIKTQVAGATALPFAGASFDFAAAFMVLMDVGEPDAAIGEAFRVLKPGGFLQFSITHPCFDTPHRRQLRDQTGMVYAVEVGGYFDELDGDISEWLFSAAPPEARAGLPPFKTPRFTRTLSRWLNLLVDTGFLLEHVEEPRPDDQEVSEHPNIQDAQVTAYFLIIRVRKPA
jgi:ubiquinone/menaquinone biosynthesis C-methylase UbiE